MNERITEGATPLGQLLDFAALRQSFESIHARRMELDEQQRQAIAAKEAEANATWHALPPPEQRECRVRFLECLGFQPETAGAAGRIPIGNARKTDALRHIELWAQSRRRDSRARGRWACGILGGCGVGKTFGAARWCLGLATRRDGRLLEDVGRHIAVVRARNLARLDIYRDLHALHVLRTARHLVIDDLGSEFLDDAFSAKLEDIIDHRHGHDLDTLITSNLPNVGALTARYGARVMDRVGFPAWTELKAQTSLRP